MGQLSEYVPTSASQAATNHCVRNSIENSVTSSHQYRHLPRNFEEVTHSDDTLLFNVTMAPPLNSNFGSPKIWHICNIQSKICDHSMYISIKKHPEICPILEFVSESGITQCNRKRWASVCYWMPESRRDRCQTQILWHMMLKIPKSHLTFFSRSNSGVTWQTSGSHASRPPVNNLSFCSRRGCCVLPTQPTGPKNGSFDQIYALTSDSYTTNSDWHTWKYQSVTRRLNFFFLKSGI